MSSYLRTGTWEGGTHSNSQYMSPAAQCDKQDLVEETGTPVYDIVQEFADDHSVWAEAFLGLFLDALLRIKYTQLWEIRVTTSLLN